MELTVTVITGLWASVVLMSRMTSLYVNGAVVDTRPIVLGSMTPTSRDESTSNDKPE